MKFSLANLLAVAVLLVSIAAVISMSGSGFSGECRAKPGYIFSDCVDPSWYGISSWEMSFDNITQHMKTTPDSEDLIHWQVIPSDSEAHGNILDVRYGGNRANGRLRFHAAVGGNFVDMTDYAGGSIQFDLRVLEWGLAERILVVRVMCGYPCGSDAIRVSLKPHNRWQEVRIPIKALTDTGLDLSRVDIGLALSPTWNRMQGIHFQLDNIRWLKPQPAETE